MLTVHTNVFAPTVKPVTPDAGSAGDVTVALPAITVHAPVPTVGKFPANEVAAEQTTSSGPAFEVVGEASRVIVTVSFVDGQTPLLMVHTKLFAPADNPETPDAESPGVVTVALPAMTVHAPVPTVGAFPASVADAAHTC